MFSNLDARAQIYLIQNRMKARIGGLGPGCIHFSCQPLQGLTRDPARQQVKANAVQMLENIIAAGKLVCAALARIADIL